MCSHTLAWSLPSGKAGGHHIACLLFNLTDECFPFNRISVGLYMLLGSLECWFTHTLTLMILSWQLLLFRVCEQLLITTFFSLLETFSEPPCTFPCSCASSQFCNTPLPATPLIPITSTSFFLTMLFFLIQGDPLLKVVMKAAFGSGEVIQLV